MTNLIRLIAAGCFVFAGMLAMVALMGATGWVVRGPIVGLVGAPIMFLLIGVALWLFNPRGSDPFGRKTPEEHLRELESLGLLESTDFRAVRAFGVEEYEDEGLHYYLQLEDGRVLFLSGQYLYDFEPITDDPEINQSRQFPCSEFTLRRHRTERYVADIQCRGTVLEPEVMAPSFGPEVWKANRIPEDGDIISDRSYDEVKRERLGARPGVARETS